MLAPNEGQDRKVVPIDVELPAHPHGLFAAGRQRDSDRRVVDDHVLAQHFARDLDRLRGAQGKAVKERMLALNVKAV